MSAARIASCLSAAFAALVRSQSIAAAGTALYRNQQIASLPPRAQEPSRRRTGKAARRYATPPIPFCPMLPHCAAE